MQGIAGIFRVFSMALPGTATPPLAPPLAVAGRDVEEFVTEFRNVPEGWLFVAAGVILLGALFGIVWMYKHEGRVGASGRARALLALIRCVVFVILGVILLEPARVKILRRWIDSYTLLLVDGSSSMDLSDVYRDPEALARAQRIASQSNAPFRRADLVGNLLRRNDGEWLESLADKNRVKVFTFADEPKLVGIIRAAREHANKSETPPEGAPPTWNVSEVPTNFPAVGAVTNVDRAFRRAVDSLGGAPISAVVVVSDGGFNQGSPAEDVGRFALERGIPIHAVGIGDPSPPRNVRVAELVAPQNAFQQDPFALSARIVAEGLESQSVTVELRERNASEGGEGRVVASKALVMATGSGTENVTFQHRQHRAGRYAYSIEVPVMPMESVADDNSKQTTVNVIESRTRTLIVAGSASSDYQFVTRLFERDNTFDVSCWLQSADLSAVRDGDVVIDHLPSTPEELFAYDLIILMDPNPLELTEEWCRLLDKWVTEYGGGLLFAAARTYTASAMRQPGLKLLRDLLPVSLDPEADLVLNRVGFYQMAPVPVEIPDPAFGHPVLQLADDPVSTKLAWQGRGEVHWHYPVLREKPAATVLMRHSDPRMRNSNGGHVLAAVQFVGAGRSAYLGMDGTFRWRRHGEAMFNRFWVQMARFLAEGKLLGGTKRGMLLTERDQYNLGDAVSVTARLFDARYEPLTRDQVAAQYGIDRDRTEFVLRSRSDRPGWFEGRFVPDRVGSFRVSLRVPDSGAGESDESAELVREVRVSRPNLEILKPQMDRAALKALAESSGGKFFEIDEAGELSKLIPDLHEEIAVRSSPTSLWDRGAVLAVLIGLLGVEWAVRKWRHLL